MNILLISNKDYKEYLKDHKVTKSTNYYEIIKYLEKDFGAIIIDSIVNINILKLLNNYPKYTDLSKTIIIDNHLVCYNLFPLFNIISSDKIAELDYSIKEINKRNIYYIVSKSSIYDEISIILKRLGLSPDKTGFHYLRKAIYECYNDPNLINDYKKIYNLLEESFLINKKDIERSIRYSIYIGFKKSDYDYSEKLFSNTLSYEQIQPKNSEFIAIVLEELLSMHHKTYY